MAGTKFVDSGGGFLLDPNTFAKKPGPNAAAAAATSSSTSSSSSSSQPLVPLEGPAVYAKCCDCLEPFTESTLLEQFGLSVCDRCREPDGAHSLITRTEAKAEYLLKDCDFDKREPPLRFICRRNPHNERWGDMKLYLHLQVEQRALEVWGSEEALLEQREQRDEKREKAKLSKYNKNMKQLRMEMRSSLFDRTSAAQHEHEFGEERYDEERDVYEQECVECGFKQEFEKM